MNKVTVVVPVYGDWPSLQNCIESLKANLASQHQVMLVNDCGPEVDLMENNIKQAIAGLNNFSYFRNSKNLGFVGTCNRAVMELDKTSNDILLLNSDTIVTAGFLEAMQATLANDNIAAVSPRSNNATLATVPLWAASQKGIDRDQSYQIFQAINTKLPDHYIAPVAHGFCMLIKRELIKKFGLFDKVFGKGYGEEVDFCLRLQKNGYHSAICNRAFVFHIEARSFSPETKAKLLNEHNHIIWQRYPNYRQAVRDYMQKTIAAEKLVETQAGFKPKADSIFKKIFRRLKNN